MEFGASVSERRGTNDSNVDRNFSMSSDFMETVDDDGQYAYRFTGGCSCCFKLGLIDTVREDRCVCIDDTLSPRRDRAEGGGDRDRDRVRDRDRKRGCGGDGTGGGGGGREDFG